MATFHVIGKLKLTILVFDFEVIQVTKNILYVMFVFRRGFVHVSEDVSYVEDNIVLSFIYQVLDVNFTRMFWIIINGKYQIINDHALNNFQDIVLTLGTSALVANITVEGVMMKEDPIAASNNLKFFILIMESSFINLYDSFDEDDPSLLDVVVPIFVNSRPIEK
jgi:hypothetical protein